MNMKFVTIQIECRSGNILYKFGQNITAIYGNIGVGKTSLINLLSFCLGNHLIRTPAIDNQVLGVSLTVSINEEIYLFKRRISSNYINVKTQNGELQLKVKNNQCGNTITDFFYELAGMNALFFTPKNRTSYEKHIKLTFSNFFWFSYLRQDEIDNSLFYFGDLQNYFKNIASNGVFFELLGGNNQIDTKYQNQIRKYVAALNEAKKKMSFGNELRKVTPLFSINISEEISKKKKYIFEMKQSLNLLNKSPESPIDSTILSKLLSIQYKIGLYEAEIKYLLAFGKVKSVLDSQISNESLIKDKIIALKNKRKKNVEKNEFFKENIKELCDILLEILLEVSFPGVEKDDKIIISSRNFIPMLCSFTGKKKFDFYNLSSGGKKTIYKLCYALSFHKLIFKKKLHTLIPNVLIIDTPMKNISEREDIKLYNSLFSLLEKLFSKEGELSQTQLIIVDKELHPYLDNDNVQKYHFSNEKPLIPYYKN